MRHMVFIGNASVCYMASSIAPEIIEMITTDAAKKNKIGEGSFGAVVTCIDTPNIVYKIYQEEKIEYATLREMSSLILLSSSPEIVSLHGVTMNNHHHIIALEKFNGNLKIKRKYEEAHVKAVLTSIITALVQAANHGIFHRDVKPENILCSSDMDRIVLCDFGLARFNPIVNGTDRCITGKVQTGWYRAPELRVKTTVNKYNPVNIDVWSIGIIAIEMLRGKFLKDCDTNTDFLTQISKYFGRPYGCTKLPPRKRKSVKFITSRHDISDQLIEVIELMTTVDYRKRPDIYTIANHPYFSIGVTRTPVVMQYTTIHDMDVTIKFRPAVLEQYAQHRQQIIGNFYELLKSNDDEHDSFTYPIIYNAIMYFDLFLSNYSSIDGSKLVLYALTALAIAFRIYGLEQPSLDSYSSYTSDDIEHMVPSFFKTFNYMMFIPTTYDYIRVHYNGEASQRHRKVPVSKLRKLNARLLDVSCRQTDQQELAQQIVEK